ncbi:MAG TPA: hypothetical protein VME86_03540 [Acidobacteriaceae bacterium]|nr:hypothetical protein [Acidobacteriaceae bacterium]
MLKRYMFLMLLVASSVTAAQMTDSMSKRPGDSSHGSVQNLPTTDCPWLTKGTAADALRGDVNLSVSMSNMDNGTCRFSRQQKPSGVLEIIVSKSALQTCPPNSQDITGVGNSAKECSGRAHHGEATAMISGQTRNTYFTVRLTLHAKKDDPELNAAVEAIAEEVAGNLY